MRRLGRVPLPSTPFQRVPSKIRVVERAEVGCMASASLRGAVDERRYSPPEGLGARKHRIGGNLDPEHMRLNDEGLNLRRVCSDAKQFGGSGRHLPLHP